MKKSVAKYLGLCSFLCLLVVAQPFAVQAKTTLKIAHASSEDSLIHNAMLHFKKEIEANAGGTVVKIYPNGQLGDEGPIADGVGAGAIDIGLGGVIDAIDPKLGVITLPFLFDDFANVHTVLDGPFGKKLLAMGQDKGFHLLGFLDSGFRNFSNNQHPIVTPEDMQGLKLRCPPNPVILATIKQLGALPQSIPFGEVYTALQSNVVDGAEPELRDFDDQKWYEVQKYVTIANYLWTPNYWFMNKAKYDALKPEVKSAIDAAVVSTTAWYRGQLASIYDKIIANAKAKGVKVNSIDPKPFKALVGPVYEKFAKEYGNDLLAEVQNAAEAARK